MIGKVLAVGIPLGNTQLALILFNRARQQQIHSPLNLQQRLGQWKRKGCRSLNLSNTVAVAVYEAWRQNGFK